MLLPPLKWIIANIIANFLKYFYRIFRCYFKLNQKYHLLSEKR